MGGGETDLPEGAALADLVRRLRSEAGLTQEQLARELGVSFVTVNRWESGKGHVSAAHARALFSFEPPGTERRGDTHFFTSFVGREQELSVLSDLIDEHRLVTLVGPGGIGKTRLAVEAVKRRARGSAVFVALEPVARPEGLLTAVAAQLKVRDRPGIDPVDTMANVLSADGPLLVLDGAEHLSEAVAELVDGLLARTVECRILLTSRRVLSLPGEAVYTLGPLACPAARADASAVLSSEAVQLFISRARQRSPHLEVGELEPGRLAELCRRLEGLPLAIELLAGWVGTFSVNEILERASDLLEADHTGSGAALREVAEQSWRLLSAEQQSFVSQLSVMRGSFELDDATAVTCARPPETARLLRQLVDSSFLIVRPGAVANRFQMLETMRVFVSSHLEEETRATATLRHTEHFCQLALQSESKMMSPEAAAWGERIALSWPDIEAALGRLAAERRLDDGLKVTAALWPWWLSRGRLALGRAQLETFLSMAGGRDDETVARASCAAAVLAAEHGAYGEARQRAVRARRTFERHGREADLAVAATVIGSASRYLDETETAREGFSEALARRRRLGDERGVAVALNNLALLALDAGSYGEADELFAESISLKRRLGNAASLAIGLSNHATVLIRQGRFAEASELLEEATAISERLDNPQLEGSIAANLGEVAGANGEWESALAHFELSLVAVRAGGHAHDEVVALVGIGRALARLGRRTEALERLREAEAVASATGNLSGLGKARAALGELGEESRSLPPGGLTAREAEVLRLLALGSSSKEIAGALGLKVRTVEHHVASIYRKLNAGGRVEATRWAVAHGVVGAGPSPAGSGGRPAAGSWKPPPARGGRGSVAPSGNGDDPT